MNREKRGPLALEEWARQLTDGYRGVTVRNMTTSWRNGMAFCALIHRFHPSLIEYDKLDPSDIIGNCSLAFEVAESKLGIPALLDPIDMAAHEVPDRLSVLTYVAQYYSAFKNADKKSSVSSNSEHGDLKTGSSDKSQSPSPEKNKAKRKMEVNEDEIMDSVRRSMSKRPVLLSSTTNVCSECQNPVYISERVLFMKKLYHRSCFRCYNCKRPLNPHTAEFSLDGLLFCLETPCHTELQRRSREKFMTEHKAQISKDKPVEIIENIFPGDISSRQSEADDVSLSLSASVSGDVGDNSNSEHSFVSDRIPTPSLLEGARSVSPTISLQNKLNNCTDTNGNNSNNNSQLDDSSHSRGEKQVARNVESMDIQVSLDSGQSSASDIAIVQGAQSGLSVSLKASSERSLSEASDILIKQLSPTNSSSDIENVQRVARNEWLHGQIEDKEPDDVMHFGVPIISRRLSNGSQSEEINVKKPSENPIVRDPASLRGTEQVITTVVVTPSDEGQSQKESEGRDLQIEESESSLTIISNCEDSDSATDGPVNLVTEVDSAVSFNADNDSSSALHETNGSSSSVQEGEDVPSTFHARTHVANFLHGQNDSYSSLQDENDSSSVLLEKSDLPSDAPIEADSTTKLSEQSDSNSSVQEEHTSSDSFQEDRLTTQEKNNSSSSLQEEPTIKHFSDRKGSLSSSPPINDLPVIFREGKSSVTQNFTSSPKVKRRAPQPKDLATTVAASATYVVNIRNKPTINDNAVELSKKDSMVDYPADLNPFESDENLEPTQKSRAEPKNPFEEDDDEEDQNDVRPVPVPSPRPRVRNIPPVQEKSENGHFESINNPPPQPSPRKSVLKLKAKEYNPFEEDEDDDIGEYTEERSDRVILHDETSSICSKLSDLSNLSSVPTPTPRSLNTSDVEGYGSMKIKSRKTRRAPLPPNLGPPISCSTAASTPTSTYPPTSPKSILKTSFNKGRLEPNNTTPPDVSSNNNAGSSGTSPSSPKKLIPVSPDLLKGLKNKTNRVAAQQYSRKKRRAPPPRRRVDPLPEETIKTELHDLEIKERELERQGITLESNIRRIMDEDDETESSCSNRNPNEQLDEMMIQLWGIVNEKNDILRRQTELEYLRRGHRLEEMQAELEFQLRVLMDTHPSQKLEGHAEVEQMLLDQMLKLVDERNEVVDWLDYHRKLDREEDLHVSNSLTRFSNSNRQEGQNTVVEPIPDIVVSKSSSKGKKAEEKAIAKAKAKALKEEMKAAKKEKEKDKDLGSKLKLGLFTKRRSKKTKPDDKDEDKDQDDTVDF